MEILQEVYWSFPHFLMENTCCGKIWAEMIPITFFVGAPPKKAKNKMSKQKELPSSCKNLVPSCFERRNWWGTKRLFDLLLPMLHLLFKWMLFKCAEDEHNNFLHTNRSSYYCTECVKFVTLISQSYAILLLNERSVENLVGRKKLLKNLYRSFNEKGPFSSQQTYPENLHIAATLWQIYFQSGTWGF